jgi:ribonuclease P protein component
LGEHSFPASCRLHSTGDYQRVYRNGRRFPAKHFLLFCHRSPEESSRIGLAVGRKVGPAVVRNLVKRRLREILRRLRADFPFPVDVVIVAHPGSAALDQAGMELEVRQLLRNARLLEG